VDVIAGNRRRTSVRYGGTLPDRRAAQRQPALPRHLKSNNATKHWISDADSSGFCQLSLSEDAIPRKGMGIRYAERVPKNV
jgi:hypothetical protein